MVSSTPPLDVVLQAGSSGVARLPPDMLVLTVGLALASLAPVAVAAVLALDGQLTAVEESTTAATDRTSEAERRSVRNTESIDRDRTITPSGRSER